jgi:hypothetical protein
VAMHSDSQLIDALGGPAKVALMLGYDTDAGGVQRVSNWKKRGIPSKVKVERPDLFMVGSRGVAHVSDRAQVTQG